MLFSTCAFRGKRRQERRSFRTDVNTRKINAGNVGNNLNVKNASVKSVYHINMHTRVLLICFISVFIWCNYSLKDMATQSFCYYCLVLVQTWIHLVIIIQVSQFNSTYISQYTVYTTLYYKFHFAIIHHQVVLSESTAGFIHCQGYLLQNLLPLKV